MRLVHKDTGREVREGETVISFRGEAAIVTGWREPHKPSSTGRVYVKEIASGFGREFFPGVFGLVFVEKEVTK